MATSSTATLYPDPETVFGGYLVIVILSSCLYGVTCLQTWYLFRHYNDQLLLRVAVLAILILETVHEIMAIHAIYHYLILNFANPLASLEIVWSVIGIIAVTDGLNTIVHLFYATRIYKVSNKKGWWICVILCILKIVQLVLSIYVMIGGSERHNYMYTEDKSFMIMAITTHSCAAAEDIICALALSYYLHRSRSGVKSTNTLINKLIVHAINNGALTSVAGIVSLSLMISQQRSLIYVGTFTILGNLYSNSMLSTLNSRKYHTQTMMPVTVDTTSSSFIAARNFNATGSTYTADTHTTNITKPDIHFLIETSDQPHDGQNNMELSNMKVNPE